MQHPKLRRGSVHRVQERGGRASTRPPSMTGLVLMERRLIRLGPICPTHQEVREDGEVAGGPGGRHEEHPEPHGYGALAAGGRRQQQW